MNSRFKWESRVGILGVLLMTLVITMVLVFVPNRKPMTTPQVAIFDARLRIFWAQMRKGSNTYYLPAGGNVLRSEGRLGSTVEGKVRWEIRKLGINIDTLPFFRPGTNLAGRAFLIGYSFPVPRPVSEHLVAELAAEDGTSYLLRSAAGGGEGPPERSWSLWTLDSLPASVTNYALRLKLGTNGLTIAELRFLEP